MYLRNPGAPRRSRRREAATKRENVSAGEHLERQRAAPARAADGSSNLVNSHKSSRGVPGGGAVRCTTGPRQLHGFTAHLHILDPMKGEPWSCGAGVFVRQRVR